MAVPAHEAAWAQDKPRNLKEWEDKYRYFSHTAQDRRTKEQCRFFPDLKSKDKYIRYMNGQGKPLEVESSTKEFEVVKEKDYYSYDKIMARTSMYLEYSQAVSPSFNKPQYSKYKYFGGGGGIEHLERDRKGDDPLVEWRKKCRPQTAPDGSHQPAQLRYDDDESFVSLSKDVSC